MPLTIKVYSDYVCPFCFLAEFPLQEAIRGKDVAVEWMPFELRPEPTPTLRPGDAGMWFGRRMIGRTTQRDSNIASGSSTAPVKKM